MGVVAPHTTKLWLDIQTWQDIQNYVYTLFTKQHARGSRLGTLSSWIL